VPLFTAGRLDTVSVFDAPYEYENRLEPLAIRGLKKLKLFVPERHDWAFMKITRLLEKDIKHIQEAAKTVGFSKELFLERFLSEMTHIEPQRRLILDFLAMMEVLYGKAEANHMEGVIKSKWK